MDFILIRLHKLSFTIENGNIQVLFRLFEWFSSIYLFKANLIFKVSRMLPTCKPTETFSRISLWSKIPDTIGPTNAFIANLLNSAEIDQTSPKEQSDQGLHFFLLFQKNNLRIITKFLGENNWRLMFKT